MSVIRDLAESVLVSCDFSKERQEALHVDEYRERVLPYLEGKPVVTVKQETLKNILWLAGEIVKVKVQEEHHQTDGEKEYKRFYTGLLGEAALEQFFGIPIIDWSVGDSKKYKNSDLMKAGYDVGVKTSEFWKFPLVSKDISRPQIITVRLDERSVMVAGYAPVDLLRSKQIGKYVLSNGARNRKGAFHGFSGLHTVKGKDCLDAICPERFRCSAAVGV